LLLNSTFAPAVERIPMIRQFPATHPTHSKTLPAALTAAQWNILRPSE
jgi:hypothetical protein